MLMGESVTFRKIWCNIKIKENVSERDESHLCELLSVFELLLDFLFTLCKNYSSSIQINFIDL